MAFRITKESFSGRDPLLYYCDDDGFPWNDDKRLEIINELSSGIADVRVENIGTRKNREGRAVVFRLSEKNIRKYISLSGKQVDTAELGGYVFMLPRAGEFFCELGEIIDGKPVPLHIDDFCMK